MTVAKYSYAFDLILEIPEQEQDDRPGGPRQAVDDSLEPAAKFAYSVTRAGTHPAVAAHRGARSTNLGE
jgi:hypothetical protein